MPKARKLTSYKKASRPYKGGAWGTHKKWAYQGRPKNNAAGFKFGKGRSEYGAQIMKSIGGGGASRVVRKIKKAVGAYHKEVQGIDTFTFTTNKKPSKWNGAYKALGAEQTTKFTYPSAPLLCAAGAQGVGFLSQSALGSNGPNILICYGGGAKSVAAGTTCDVRTVFDAAATAYNTTAPALITQDPWSTANYASQKYFIKSINHKYRIANMNTTPIEVDLYFLMSKNTSVDNIQSPQDDWITGLQDIKGNNPALTSTSLGIKPTASMQFNMNWKILKKEKLFMPGGKQQNVAWNIKYNRIVDTDYFKNFWKVKGYTHTIMAVYSGGVGDTANSFAAGTISTGKVKLDVISEITYNTRLLAFYPRSFNLQNSITAPAQIWEAVEGSAAIVDAIGTTAAFLGGIA